MTVSVPDRDRSGAGSTLEVVLGAVLVLGSAAALHRLGSGPLAAPPLTSPDGVQRWMAERDAVTIGIALARLAVLVVLYHLVVTTAIALAGRALGRPGWARLADAATLPPLRGWARRLAGLGLSIAAAAAPAVPPVGAGPPPGAPAVDLHTGGDGGLGDPVSLRRLADRAGPDDAVVTLEVVEPGGGGADLLLVPDGSSPHGGAAPGPPATPEPEPEAGSTSAEQVGTAARTDATVGAEDTDGTDRDRAHVVEPGDHLWAIAEQTLRDRGDGTPSADAVAAYWRTVLAANPQVVDPDLVYPGDTITLPPLP